jgi:hypothetical protein
LIQRDGQWWPQLQRQRCYNVTGFHRLALVPVEIVHAPDVDPPMQLKETHESPVYLDTSDVSKDGRRLFYQALLLSIPWLSADVRSALLKESGSSEVGRPRSRPFLWSAGNVHD